MTLTIVLCFTLPCLMTTLGAGLVFFFNKTSKMVNMLTIGLAAGIMLSASIWSLLVPALENAEESMGKLAFLPVVLGFALGCGLMVFLDYVCSHLFKVNQNAKTQKAFKLFTAITIHNIPEGLAVGFAIGNAVSNNTSTWLALMFAVGIALQNFPEGLATALPIQNCIKNRKKSFFFATLSGIVEPLFGVIGFFLAAYITSLLPWLLALSAGAMIYVIIEEMVPELHVDNRRFGTWAFVIGFLIMMILDICL